MPIKDDDILFLKAHAQQHLEDFTNKVRQQKGNQQWRCLYTLMDSDLTREVSTKNIATTYLQSSMDNADDVKVFWLTTGHLFIFFQGPVRYVIRDFEKFLDFTNEGNRRPEYHFFWEVGEFWGYFDQVLSGAINDLKEEDEKEESEKTLEKAPREKDGDFLLSEELVRSRHVRYKPLLLIIEDDNVTRHLIQAAMEKYCDIVVAWQAEQAKQFYQNTAPNIVFLDIQLPGGDGLELADLFCSHDPDAFVVMVSGGLSEERVARCKEIGVKGFIAKPATEEQLLHFVNVYNKSRGKA